MSSRFIHYAPPTITTALLSGMGKLQISLQDPESAIVYRSKFENPIVFFIAMQLLKWVGVLS